VSGVNLSQKDLLVRMKGIVKRFPGVVANDHADFELGAGEVHGLLGENGAGKTTLMNILYGIHRPDECEIYIREKKVTIGSPREATNLGIGMVHQHFKLVNPHTVPERSRPFSSILSSPLQCRSSNIFSTTGPPARP